MTVLDGFAFVDIHANLLDRYKARSTAPTYANSRRTSTYYPDMRESAAAAQARNKQAEAQAPRYSNKVDAYRRANVQSGRRERG